MLLNFHLPNYFNKTVRQEIGELYASSAIRNMATSMMMLFEPIFLYSVLNFTIPQILLFMAVTYAVYAVCIPWGGRLASVYGYKHTIAIAAPFLVFYWLCLLVARDNMSLAFLAAVILGLEKTFFWPAFHALMARYADKGQVGREFGIVYAIISVTHIAGPLLAGWISQVYGFTATFIIASLIHLGSIFPLFQAKEIFIPKTYSFSQTLELYRQFPKKALGYMGFGEELLVLVIWPVFIYMTVKNYEETGFIATVASLVAAILAVIIGKITDQYTKRILIKMGAFFSALVWLARLAPATPANVLAIDTMSRTSKEMAFIPISTVTYIRAEQTHVVPYVVFFEQSLAIGKLLAAILGIVVFALTGSFVALFILAALFSLLYMFI